MSAGSRVFLVDGSGFIFRAYHALPPLTRADGTPVGAVLGFSNMLLKLVEESKATHLAVVFDVARTSFRTRLYAQYKAHRPEPPADLVPQFKLVRDATDAFNVCRIELADYEADDLIATLARHAAAEGASVTIVSSDKDMMQLVGERIIMFDPIKQKPIGPAEVQEKFGVGPEQVVDVQALCGDSVDNVPGVPGIGIKTAAELITAWHDLENLLAHAGEIKQPKRRQALTEFAAQARLSKELVTLDGRVPMPCDLATLAVKPWEQDKLTGFLREQGFRALLRRIDPNPVAPAASTPKSPAVPEVAAMSPVAPPDLAHVTKHYELIQDVAALDRWIIAASEAGAVAVDTETNSLEAWRADLVGVSLAVEPGRACYIPLGHKGAPSQGSLGLDEAAVSEAPRQIPMEEALARLKPMLEDPGVLKIGQNIKYDLQVFARYGIVLAPFDCTMLISFVLDGGKHGHGMDELAKLHFGYDTIKYKEVAGTGRSHIGFAAVPLDRACDYAAEDADITLRLHRALKPRLVPERRLAFYETIERPLVPVVAAMERAGIRVDRRPRRGVARSRPMTVWVDPVAHGSSHRRVRRARGHEREL
ncbi:MAG TPA: 5'-3' exonuclease H3TH domain-containing protein, partial [Stellaceae bacterium]|nr:5'-3' exonuclease H3TH domain-containing protein [Stellaceae bacterium]